METTSGPRCWRDVVREMNKALLPSVPEGARIINAQVPLKTVFEKEESRAGDVRQDEVLRHED